jgi:glycosyltransferase involved in cell wall biosynthesis
MRLSLIITTYERPQALARVLHSIASQCRPPDELIVADDGSTVQTRMQVLACAQTVPYPLLYVRQEHEGFRLARLRNLALAAATGDYVVFIDGDMVLHRQFLGDHERAARRGYYTQGVRIPLDPRTTQSVIEGACLPRFFDAGIVGRRRLYAIYNRRMQRMLRGLGRVLLAIKGCNQGFWRDDLLQVNGYDERFIGWGAEDKDLCWRLELGGVRRQGLLAGALAYHLYHPPAARDRADLNLQRLQDNQKKRRMRCAYGVDHHC